MLYQFLGDFKFLIRYSDICIHNMYVQAYLIKQGKHFAHNNSVLQNKKSKGQNEFFFFFSFLKVNTIPHSVGGRVALRLFKFNKTMKKTKIEFVLGYVKGL